MSVPYRLTARLRIEQGLSALRSADPFFVALCVLLTVYYWITPGIFEGKASGDGLVAFYYFPGLWFHGSLDMARVAPAHVAAAFGRESTGLVANPNPIGPPLLWIPFFFLSLVLKKGLLLVGALLGRAAPAGLLRALPELRQPYCSFDYFVTGLGSLFYGLVGVSRVLRLLLRHTSLSAARFGALVATLASPLAWYLTTQPLYQHACAFFAVSLLVERWDAYRTEDGGDLRLRHAAILGALGGLCLLMRTQQGVWLLLPGWDLLTRFLRVLGQRSAALRDRLRAALAVVGRAAAFLLCAVVTFAPQAALWVHYYGRLRPPQKPGHIRWGDPAIVELLFSTRAGLFPWVPILYLVVPGLLWLLLRRARARTLVVTLCLVFLAQIYINAAVFDFHASWSFGPRRFTECVVVLALGLAALWQALSRRGRLVLALVAAAAVLWNCTLVELMRTRRIKSSSSGAFPASIWVRWAHGPEWLARFFDRAGYPFAQPAAALFSLRYGVPMVTFEGVVGNYLLDRDLANRSLVVLKNIYFSDPWSTYVVDGMPQMDRSRPRPPGPPIAMSPTGPTVRVLVPLRAQEPLRLIVRGQLGPRPEDVGVRWNGTALPARPIAGGLWVDVPQAVTTTHARANVLELTGLSPEARLQELDFESLGDWWRSR